MDEATVQEPAIVRVDAGVTALASAMSEHPGAQVAELLGAQPQPLIRVATAAKLPGALIPLMRITTQPGTAAELLEAEPQPLRQVERVRIHAVTAQMVSATMVAPVLFTPIVH